MVLREALQNWYKKHQRDLPWRHTKDPYTIWLSEIILQQTRVDQGLPYFQKFIDRYPKVSDLAAASQQEVLNLWQGLGYYSRGRNLHNTAQVITQKYNAVFPKTYTELIGLKGVGGYTAAAIASFAYNLPHAVVDGNVFRVLARYYGVELPINTSKGATFFNELANELLDKNAPGLHNQAIMEFGALQCKPVSPNCFNCPVINTCVAFKENKVAQLPVKIKKKKVSQRFFVYHLIKNKRQQLAFYQRGPNDIWEGLFEFPLKEFKSAEELALYLSQKKLVGTKQKHLLTHQKIEAYFIFDTPNHWNQHQFVYLSLADLSNHPIPRLIDKFLVINHSRII